MAVETQRLFIVLDRQVGLIECLIPLPKQSFRSAQGLGICFGRWNLGEIVLQQLCALPSKLRPRAEFFRGRIQVGCPEEEQFLRLSGQRFKLLDVFAVSQPVVAQDVE